MIKETRPTTAANRMSISSHGTSTPSKRPSLLVDYSKNRSSLQQSNKIPSTSEHIPAAGKFGLTRAPLQGKSTRRSSSGRQLELLSSNLTNALKADRQIGSNTTKTSTVAAKKKNEEISFCLKRSSSNTSLLSFIQQNNNDENDPTERSEMESCEDSMSMMSNSNHHNHPFNDSLESNLDISNQSGSVRRASGGGMTDYSAPAQYYAGSSCMAPSRREDLKRTLALRKTNSVNGGMGMNNTVPSPSALLRVPTKTVVKRNGSTRIASTRDNSISPNSTSSRKTRRRRSSAQKDSLAQKDLETSTSSLNEGFSDLRASLKEENRIRRASRQQGKEESASSANSSKRKGRLSNKRSTSLHNLGNAPMTVLSSSFADINGGGSISSGASNGNDQYSKLMQQFSMSRSEHAPLRRSSSNSRDLLYNRSHTIGATPTPAEKQTRKKTRRSTSGSTTSGTTSSRRRKSDSSTKSQRKKDMKDPKQLTALEALLISTSHHGRRGDDGISVSVASLSAKRSIQ